MEQGDFSNIAEGLKKNKAAKLITNRNLFIKVVVSFVLVGLLSTFFLNDYLKKIALENLTQDNAKKTSELVFEVLFAKMQSGWSKQDIDNITTRLNHLKTGMKISIYRSAKVEELFGVIEKDRNKIKEDKFLQKAMTGEIQLIHNENDNSIRYIYPMKVEQDCLSCHVNSKVGDINGVIDMYMPSDDIQIPLNNIMRYFLIFTAVCIVLTFFIFEKLMQKIFVKPISDFTEAIDRISVNSEFNEYVHCNPKTHEISVLEATFNHLLFRVNDMLAEIRNKNKLLEEYKKAIDSSTIVTKTDKRGVITYANEQFCLISGYTADELLGQNHNIVRHSNMPKEAFAEVWRTIQEKKAWRGVVENSKKNGESYFVQATIMPILDTEDNITEYIAIRQDITELLSRRDIAEAQLRRVNENLTELVNEETQKRMENERLLIQQNRSATMGEMIGNIAHQWRQPLNALGITIQSLGMEHNTGLLDEERIKQISLDCMKQINFMSKTIDDFRSFFSPDKDQKEFYAEETVDSTIRLLSAKLKNNDIEYKIEVDKKHILYGYEGELQQVLLNLISNAADAIIDQKAQTRVIKISINSNESSIFFVVEDTAGGIQEGIMDKIFDPYFTTKEQGKGTGIGLYMSKQIVERHMQGALGVQNSESGAMFVITLPLQNKTAEQPERQ